MKIFAFAPKRTYATVGLTGIATFIVTAFFMALSPPASAAQADSKVAVLSVSGPASFDATVSSSPAAQKPTVYQATLRPVISNSGTADAMVAFKASLDDASGDCALSTAGITVTADLGTPFTLAPGDSAVPVLTMLMPRDCTGSSGTVIIAGGPDVTPVTLRFALDRDVQESVYWTPVICSAVAAVLFVAVMMLRIGFGKKVGGLGDAVATGPGWSFSDSWLTNVSAVGAILTTVLAATGFLATILPGTPTGRFVGLSLLFGGCIVMAPVIYSAAGKWEWSHHDGSPDTLVSVGRVWGVILAAGATVAGVFGELGTLLTLTITATGSDGPKELIYALLAAAALIVAYYSVQFTCGVTKEENVPPRGNAGQQPKTHRPVSGTL